MIFKLLYFIKFIIHYLKGFCSLFRLLPIENYKQKFYFDMKNGLFF